MSDTLRAQLEQKAESIIDRWVDALDADKLPSDHQFDTLRAVLRERLAAAASLTLDAVEAELLKEQRGLSVPQRAIVQRLRLSLSVRSRTTEEEKPMESSGEPSARLVGHGGVVEHSTSSDLAYVIFGEEGDYERNEWPVRVYFDRNAAETEAVRMNGLVLAHKEASAGDPYPEDDAAFDAWDTRRRLRLQAAASKLRDPQFDVYVADKYRVVSVSAATDEPYRSGSNQAAEALASHTDPLQAFADRLVQSQEDLPADAALVLREHLPELYIDEPTAKQASTPPGEGCRGCGRTRDDVHHNGHADRCRYDRAVARADACTCGPYGTAGQPCPVHAGAIETRTTAAPPALSGETP